MRPSRHGQLRALGKVQLWLDFSWPSEDRHRVDLPKCVQACDSTRPAFVQALANQT